MLAEYLPRNQAAKAQHQKESEHDNTICFALDFLVKLMELVSLIVAANTATATRLIIIISNVLIVAVTIVLAEEAI